MVCTDLTRAGLKIWKLWGFHYYAFTAVMLNIYANDENEKNRSNLERPNHYIWIQSSGVISQQNVCINVGGKNKNNDWAFHVMSQLVCSSTCSTGNAVYWTTWQCMDSHQDGCLGAKWKTLRCHSVCSSIWPRWLFAFQDYDCVSLWTYYFFQTATGTSLTPTPMVTSPSPPLWTPSMHTTVYPINSFTIYNYLFFSVI